MTSTALSSTLTPLYNLDPAGSPPKKDEDTSRYFQTGCRGDSTGTFTPRKRRRYSDDKTNKTAQKTLDSACTFQTPTTHMQSTKAPPPPPSKLQRGFPRDPSSPSNTASFTLEISEACLQTTPPNQTKKSTRTPPPINSNNLDDGSPVYSSSSPAIPDPDPFSGLHFFSGPVWNHLHLIATRALNQDGDEENRIPE